MIKRKKDEQDLLLKVYDAAVNEYRFNVNLAWDRTKFYLLLNSGLIAAGVGLFKLDQQSLLMSSVLIFYFGISIIISILGLQTIAIGKQYYREAVLKKTIVERELGLLEPIADLYAELGKRANLSIAVTKGQQDFDSILKPTITKELAKVPDPDAEVTLQQKVQFTSIVGHTRAVFIAMIVMEVICAIGAAAQFGAQLSP